jgi:hypothetical protein
MKLVASLLVRGVVVSASCGGDAGSPSNVAADDLLTAFAMAGFQLTETRVSDPGAAIVNPSGGTLPESVFDPNDDEGFVVYLYASAKDAEALVGSAPRVDPIRNQSRSFLSERNVAVIVQPSDQLLEEHLREILESL